MWRMRPRGRTRRSWSSSRHRDAVREDLTGVALTEPLNGTIDRVAPEPIRMDELVRQFLGARQDARKVTTDDRASYYGVAVNDQGLTPGDHPRLGPTRFQDWLK